MFRIRERKNRFLAVLPFVLVAVLVITGLLWYTGRIAFNFESFSTYANPILGVSFRYPSEWKPDTTYGTIGTVAGRYQGKNGFFGIDAIATEDDINMIVDEITNHKLQPYGKQPTVFSMKVDRQEARVIVPSKDQISAKKEVALIIRYPKPIRIQSQDYSYLVVVTDPGHVKVLADTLEFYQ